MYLEGVVSLTRYLVVVAKVSPLGKPSGTCRSIGVCLHRTHPAAPLLFRPSLFHKSDSPCIVCVCFRPIYWRQSLCSRRDVRYTFAVYLEDYTCSVYFSVQLEPTGVTQEHTRPFG